MACFPASRIFCPNQAPYTCSNSKGSTAAPMARTAFAPEGDVVRIAVHETRGAPVLADHDHVAAEEGAEPVRSVSPVEHGGPGKMPAAPDQGDSGCDLAVFAFPEDEGAIVPHDPLAVGGMEIHRHVAEGPAPLDHRGVVVGMEMAMPERRRARPASRPGRVGQADAVPEDATHGGPQVECALADGKPGVGADTDQARALALDAIAVFPAQLIQRGPALPAPADVLALVIADEAGPVEELRSRRTGSRT